MNTFAFMIHPSEISAISRKFELLGKLPSRLLERLLKYSPPFKVYKITGVHSERAQTEGWLVACPIMPRLMLELPEEYVLDKIIQTGKLAQKMGANILGLGAFSSVMGDAGGRVAKNLDIAVTTGNSYTLVTALESVRRAASLLGYDLKKCHAVVVGDAGSIGQICARILARDVRSLTLVTREKSRLEGLLRQIMYETGIAARITSDIEHALREAHIVIALTSAADVFIEPEYLRPGAVLCDVNRPRNVSKQVAEKRQDVLVLEGGVVEVPGKVNLNFGFPAGTSCAGLAETMMLALEGCYENYSLGGEFSLKQVQQIAILARKHGFRLAGLRGFEKVINNQDIAQVKKLVQVNLPS